MGVEFDSNVGAVLVVGAVDVVGAGLVAAEEGELLGAIGLSLKDCVGAMETKENAGAVVEPLAANCANC